MQFSYIKFLIICIFCSVFAQNAQVQKNYTGYNAQQRAEEIAYKFNWPDGQVPKLKVDSTADKTNLACCTWDYDTPHFVHIYFKEKKFNKYSDKAKDFILAHEIAHYYLFRTGYLPEFIVNNFITKYLFYFIYTISGSFGLLVSLYIKYTMLIPRLFLQRLIEYEADKQAALTLGDKTSAFDRFKPIAPSHKKTTFMKLTETLGLLLRTHPYHGQRKQALEQLILH